MNRFKRIISVILTVLMVFSVFQTGISVLAAKDTPNVAYDMPSISFTTSGITRVAAQANSVLAGNAIVAATPSGIPQLSGEYAAAAYAGETPAWTTITFTSDKDLSDVPTIECKNKTVMIEGPAITGNKFVWTVKGGIADAGSNLEFIVSYNYNGLSFKASAYSYVEGISQPAGVFAFVEAFSKAWWEINRHYATVSVDTRVLGVGVYGSITGFTQSDNDKRGVFDVSNAAFTENANPPYNTYRYFTNNQANTNYSDNVNNAKAVSDIYIDTSVTDSLDDINLRITSFMGDVGREHTRINLKITQKSSAALVGFVDASSGSTNQVAASQALGYHCDSDINVDMFKSCMATFNGTGFTNGATYTIVNKYNGQGISGNDPASTNVFIPLQMRFHTYNKADLRNEINRVMTTPTDSASCTSNGKGVNPQEWYYASGFAAFKSALANANAILQKPNVDQNTINNTKNALTMAYENLVLKRADYILLDERKAVADKVFENEPSYEAHLVEQLREVVDAINYDCNVIYQPSVDIMYVDLQAAIANMKLKQPDFTLINAALALTPEFPESYYTNLSVSLWKTLVSQATVLINSPGVSVYDQELMDEYAISITDAFYSLQLLPADFTALNAALELTAYPADHYKSADDYALWQTACQEGEAIAADTTLLMSAMAMIDEATAKIVNAFGALVLRDANKEPLLAALLLVPPHAKENYVAILYRNYEDAYEDGVAINNDTTLTILDDVTVANAASAITNAFDALKLLPADTVTLTSVLAMSPELPANRYTRASYKAYQDAVTEGEDLLAKPDLSIIDNDSIVLAAQKVLDTLNALVEVPEGGVFEPADGTYTVIDEDTGFIYGLAEGIYGIEDFVYADGYELTYNMTSSGFGTGTTVDLSIGGNVIRTYTIVIFGDVNGDGIVDAFDQTDLTAVTNFETMYEFGSAMEMAGDVNRDGVVDAFDLSIITSAANFEQTVSQFFVR